MKCSPVADADHQRALQPGRDDHVGPIAEHDRQAIGAAELGERGLHRLDQRGVRVDRVFDVVAAFLELVGDQMGDHFGVGRRLELVAVFDAAAA